MTRTVCWEKGGSGIFVLVRGMYGLLRQTASSSKLPDRCRSQVTGRRILIHGRSRLMGMRFQ